MNKDELIELLLKRDSLWRQACEDLRDALKYSDHGYTGQSNACWGMYLEKREAIDVLHLPDEAIDVLLASKIRPKGKTLFGHPIDVKCIKCGSSTMHSDNVCYGCNQKSLDQEFTKILHDNLNDLYEN